jgi:hypothetical protein
MLTAAKRVGADPTRSALWPAAEKFVAFLSQIASIVPVLPTQPVSKYCAVYNLAQDGMEEVIGSIPIRSTNNSFRDILPASASSFRDADYITRSIAGE